MTTWEEDKKEGRGEGGREGGREGGEGGASVVGRGASDANSRGNPGVDEEGGEEAVEAVRRERNRPGIDQKKTRPLVVRA